MTKMGASKYEWEEYSGIVGTFVENTRTCILARSKSAKNLGNNYVACDFSQSLVLSKAGVQRLLSTGKRIQPLSPRR